MGFRVLAADDAFWRPSNLMGVMNTDLAGQLEAGPLGACLWRLAPGQASTRHRQRGELEVYVVLEGTGRMRVGDELLTLAPLSAVAVDPETVRQVFNDTAADALWLVVGAPRDVGLTASDAEWMYPDGPRALPPELATDA